jgi:hypothetical protein
VRQLENLIFACAENFIRIDLRPPFARRRDRLPAWTRRTLRSRQSRQRKCDLERGPKGQHSQRSACCAVLLALRAVTACNGSVSGARAPTGVRHANSRIYRGGRHVVNRAHRRTISAAPPRRVPVAAQFQRGMLFRVARGVPCQIHLRPHTASMSAIIAAFVSGLERWRWGQAS